MLTIRPPRALICLSLVLTAGLLLTACGDGVGVSPASATATAAGVPSPPAVTAVSLSGTPATSITVGQNYSFQPSVSAGSGTVTFQIQGKPSWAAFNASTGALTGTPAAANEGTSAGITITGVMAAVAHPLVRLRLSSTHHPRARQPVPPRCLGRCPPRIPMEPRSPILPVTTFIMDPARARGHRPSQFWRPPKPRTW